MKYRILFLLFCLPMFLFAQKQVQARLDQKMNNESFKLNITHKDQNGNNFQPTRLEYYISRPFVIHDGGQRTAAKRGYFLVNGGDETILDLGSMDVDQIEGIEFSIGVDSASNHLDPAGYPLDHPLAYQNPSMHWGWVSGYRFVAYEGKSGNNLTYIFEIHSIGNELYKTVTLSTSAEVNGDTLTIPIIAEYSHLLSGIDVSGGLYAHGNLGAAGVIMENFEEKVFSAPLISSTSTVGQDIALSLYPNPASRNGQLSLELPVGFSGRLEMCDVTGSVLWHQPLSPGVNAYTLEAASPGVYFLRVWQGNQMVAIEKWVVTQ